MRQSKNTACPYATVRRAQQVGASHPLLHMSRHRRLATNRASSRTCTASGANRNVWSPVNTSRSQLVYSCPTDEQRSYRLVAHRTGVTAPSSPAPKSSLNPPPPSRFNPLPAAGDVDGIIAAAAQSTKMMTPKPGLESRMYRKNHTNARARTEYRPKNVQTTETCRRRVMPCDAEMSSKTHPIRVEARNESESPRDRHTLRER